MKHSFLCPSVNDISGRAVLLDGDVWVTAVGWEGKTAANETGWNCTSDPAEWL